MATKELIRLLAHRRWSEADGHVAIKAWRRSGLTVAAFARREGVDEQRLRRWRSRVSEDQDDVALVPVDIVTRPAASVEVVVGAVVIRVPPGFDEATLRRVLEVVTTC
jgi:transposase-like protein